MLQYLVGVDDVERVVRKVQPVHVGCREGDIRQVAPLGFGVGHVEDIGELVDGRHRSGRNPFGEIGGDCPWAATDVEQRQPRPQVGQQVARGVLCGASLVTA